MTLSPPWEREGPAEREARCFAERDPDRRDLQFRFVARVLGSRHVLRFPSRRGG